jgi:Na+/melibiose symporter-like transporter
MEGTLYGLLQGIVSLAFMFSQIFPWHYAYMNGYNPPRFGVPTKQNYQAIVSLDLVMTALPAFLSFLSFILKFTYPILSDEVSSRIEFQIDLHALRRNK